MCDLQLTRKQEFVKTRKKVVICVQWEQRRAISLWDKRGALAHSFLELSLDFYGPASQGLIISTRKANEKRFDGLLRLILCLFSGGIFLHILVISFGYKSACYPSRSRSYSRFQCFYNLLLNNSRILSTLFVHLYYRYRGTFILNISSSIWRNTIIQKEMSRRKKVKFSYYHW